MISPFSRMMSVRVPFSLTSGTTKFDMVAAGIPLNPDGTVLDAMSFGFINETPYDVRLQGYAAGQTFTPVGQNAKSWSILARSEKGLFLSKKPMFVSVQAFSTAGNPIDPAADFSGCYLELAYGRGS
jgi:hypothetical protein